VIVTIEIPAATRRKIARDAELAGRVGGVVAEALTAGAEIGAEAVREKLALGELGLTSRNPGQGGLASGVGFWPATEGEPVAAIGVHANHPAARYAAIQEHGGTITPKTARALAVPVSEEAKRHTSPRDMEGLVLITRDGRPPLLARPTGGDGLDVHWVLLSSVTLTATHWLSRGVEAAGEEISAAAGEVLADFAAAW